MNKPWEQVVNVELTTSQLIYARGAVDASIAELTSWLKAHEDADEGAIKGIKHDLEGFNKLSEELKRAYDAVAASWRDDDGR